MAVSGGYLVPTPIEGEVTAGIPVLLKSSSDTASLAIGSGWANTPVGTTALTGTYLSKDVSTTNNTDYFLGIAGDPASIGFYHWEGTTLAANRAYLEASNAASVKGFGVALNFDDVDAIQSVISDNNRCSAIYDLSGRQVSQPTRGLYLVNGKKVIVK